MLGGVACATLRPVTAPRPDLLILVKHAVPEVDPAKPPAQWELGVPGVDASRRLAAHLRDSGVDLVVSSVEPKAAETGRIVADVLDLPWQTGHDLHEHVRPEAGMLEQADFEAALRRFFDTPEAVVFGAESADTAFARFDAAVEALCRVHKDKRLCIVAHGTVISLYLARRCDVNAFATWKALGLPSYVVVDRKAQAVADVVTSV